jgi:hypothetical protein
MRTAVVVASAAAVVAIGAGAGIGLAVASPSSGSAFMPIKPGYTQSEPVGRITYQMCLDTINPTQAQILALPKDQQIEIYAVENWCQAFAIRTNPVRVAHRG